MKLTKEQITDLLTEIEKRFNQNMHRHPTLTWDRVYAQLIEQPDKIESLYEMERTGGEPDVVGNAIVFMDCSKESPKERRSLCYDKPALEARKKNPPRHDMLSTAAEMGVEVLSEEEYQFLQSFEGFDLKTSSWIKTPEKIRQLGGALFCDRRYDTVFTYHNGADSYYASRGFRTKLVV